VAGKALRASQLTVSVCRSAPPDAANKTRAFRPFAAPCEAAPRLDRASRRGFYRSKEESPGRRLKGVLTMTFAMVRPNSHLTFLRTFL